MRKRDETLQQTLLDCARGLIDEQGIESLNIRSLAKRAGVASGTVYNYFQNKEEILLALTEQHWQTVLMDMKGRFTGKPFIDQLEAIYAYLLEEITQSAGLLMGSLQNAESLGRERMRSMQGTLRDALIVRMRTDGRIRADVWTDTLTEDDFADFIIANMMPLLRGSLDIEAFLEIVRRILYVSTTKMGEENS